MGERPTGAGKSTFDLVDATKLFEALELEPNSIFLDLACGSGEYTLEAARRITGEGVVYAVDLWEEGIATLRSRAASQEIHGIRARVADISKHIPVGDRGIDVALIAAALHDLVRDDTHGPALREITRVLKRGATLAVVEFKKRADVPGPPVEVRLSPPEVKALLQPHAFKRIAMRDVGPYLYLSTFLLEEAKSHPTADDDERSR